MKSKGKVHAVNNMTSYSDNNLIQMFTYYFIRYKVANGSCNVLYFLAINLIYFIGAIASQSNVLSYIQLGHFLMIIMSVSWVYATFFFQAMCSVLGPENDSGQMTKAKFKAWYITLKSCLCCSKNNPDHYQIVKKEDGTEMKKRVQVLYVK